MLTRLAKILIVLSLASWIGLHWAVLQAVAWTGMMVTYSQDATLAEAVSKTFDGRHPCKLCRQIEHEKQSEKKSDAQAEASKLDFAYTPIAFTFCPPTLFWETGTLTFNGPALSHVPPVPPPRSLPC